MVNVLNDPLQRRLASRGNLMTSCIGCAGRIDPHDLGNRLLWNRLR